MVNMTRRYNNIENVENVGNYIYNRINELVPLERNVNYLYNKYDEFQSKGTPESQKLCEELQEEITRKEQEIERLKNELNGYVCAGLIS